MKKNNYYFERILNMDFTNLKNFMEHMSEDITPGNAIEVYLGGKCVFKYACGYSNLESKAPLTGDELFRIYSCSKVTTVTAGAQLLERGIFRLSDPLYEYVPEFKDMYIKNADGEIKKAKNPITMGDLFSMTAGFDYNFNTDGFKKARELTNGRMDTDKVIRCIASDPIHYEPGTHWQYSIGHDVLAGVISIITGKKFRDYVRENIFEPLGMKDCYYHDNEELRKRIPDQYAFTPEGSESFDIVEAQKNGLQGTGGMFRNLGQENSHVLGEEYDSGGAGIITSISDYVKLMAALANYGTGINGEKILSGYTVNLMRTNRLSGQTLEDFNWSALRGCGYGLGVRTHINKAQSGVISNLGEFGWGGATGTTVIIDPEINLGVFYAQHNLNPREEYYQPRLRNVVYSCLD